MARERVVILDDYQGIATESADWGPVSSCADLITYREHLVDDDLLAALSGATAIVAMRERTAFPRGVLDRLPSLRLLVTTGMHNAAIDLDAARDLGITVCGTGSGGYAAAELTWALILSLLRNIPREYGALLEGEWQVGIGDTVRGKVLGIIGLGRLGALVAGLGRAFGMEVTAWSQNLTDERAAECGVTRVPDLEVLMSQSDVVTVHTVLSRRTRGLISADLLALMRTTSVFVNTSRAQIVDTEALLQVLAAGSIRGAALDVFEVEPLPADSPFRGLDNVILTPHIGYVTRDNYAAFYGQAVDDIVRFWDGRPVRVLN